MQGELTCRHFIKTMIHGICQSHIMEKDEKLYQKLQDMRKWGGTASLKEYWKEFNFRFDGYERVFETEIKYQLNELANKYLFVIILIISLTSIFSSVLIVVLNYYLH